MATKSIELKGKVSTIKRYPNRNVFVVKLAGWGSKGTHHNIEFADTVKFPDGNIVVSQAIPKGTGKTQTFTAKSWKKVKE